MEITLNSENLFIEKRKAKLIFNFESGNITIGGTPENSEDKKEINKTGEYEIKNILVYAKTLGNNLAYSLTVEGKTIVLLNSTDIGEINKDVSDFVGNLDILILPASKGSNKLVESLEPRIVLPYGDEINDFFTRISKTPEFIKKYKSKEADFQGENTMFLALEK